MTDSSELVKRFDQLKSDRSVVESIWDEVERYVTPYRGKFFQDQKEEGSVEWTRFGNDFDSTAVMAHQNLAANLHGSLTSPSIRWFEIRFRQDKLNKDKAATKWLEHVSDRVYYELQDSNFNLEINETYQDLAGFGTSVLTLEEAQGSASAWNGLQFSSVPLKECFFEEDYFGRVLRFYRELQWTPQQIISKFGIDKVPECIKQDEEAGRTEKYTVLFVIYPRNNRIIPFGQKISPSKRPWEYQYILHKTKDTLGTGGHYEMSAFCARWRKTSGSMWGHSPATMSMGTIKSLNTAVKQMLEGSQQRIKPPIFAEERSIITDLDLSFDGISVVRDIEGIKAWDSGYDIYVNQEVINSLRAMVREFFFVNDLAFPQPQGTPMSATEAQIRYELMQRLLGPTLGRLQNDLLNPIVSRALRMLARDGQIDQPPPIVVDNQAEFDVEYIGPLARAQRTDRAASIERWVGFAASLAEVRPDALDNIDFDEAVRSIGRDLSVPAAAVRDEKEVTDERKVRQEQQQAMQQAMIAEQQGLGQKAIGEGQEAMRGKG